MLPTEKSQVMDVSPWPNGYGFSGRTAWWDYVLSKDEQQRLDKLIGLALLDGDIQARLVKERDESLLAAFGLSDETRAWLHSIQATSLTELAEAIVCHRQKQAAVSFLEISSEAA